MSSPASRNNPYDLSDRVAKLESSQTDQATLNRKLVNGVKAHQQRLDEIENNSNSYTHESSQGNTTLKSTNNSYLVGCGAIGFLGSVLFFLLCFPGAIGHTDLSLLTIMLLMTVVVGCTLFFIAAWIWEAIEKRI